MFDIKVKFLPASLWKQQLNNLFSHRRQSQMHVLKVFFAHMQRQSLNQRVSAPETNSEVYI